MGQNSSQMLILVDGLSQQSSTGIGGSRSYHFLDPFFLDHAHIHVGASSATLGAGAFSGAIELKTARSPQEKFLLLTGSKWPRV